MKLPYEEIEEIIRLLEPHLPEDVLSQLVDGIYADMKGIAGERSGEPSMR